MGDGPGTDPGPPARRPPGTDVDVVRRLESPVLDLVLVAAVVALFALVSAVAAGVERL